MGGGGGVRPVNHYGYIRAIETVNKKKSDIVIFDTLS